MEDDYLETNRRTFMKAAGAAGAAMCAAGESSAQNAAAPASIPGDDSRASYRTELFLDNQMLEATPGVSRRLHPAKKHLLNPIIRCDRWCDGHYMEPGDLPGGQAEFLQTCQGQTCQGGRPARGADLPGGQTCPLAGPPGRSAPWQVSALRQGAATTRPAGGTCFVGTSIKLAPDANCRRA